MADQEAPAANEPYRLPGIVYPTPEPTPENTFTAGKAAIPNAPGTAQGGATEPSDHPVVSDSAQVASERVARHESGGNRFVGYGGTDLSNAPLDANGAPLWDGKDNSHAFGLYQFEPATWARYAKPLGITDWRAPGAQEEVFRAAYRNEGYAPWAPYDKPLAAEIGWRGQPKSTFAGDLATHARANGFEWDSIDQQVATASEEAQANGASPEQVDAYLGFAGITATQQRFLQEEHKPDEDISQQSNGVISAPREEGYGTYATPAPGKAAGTISPAIAANYAAAVANNEVSSPQQFAQAYTDHIWQAAGMAGLAREHQAQATQDIAAQLPARSVLTDSALYLLRDFGGSPTLEANQDARKNLVNLWAAAGLGPQAVAQGNDPMLQDAAASKDGIVPAGVRPEPPKLTFGEAMVETGKQLADIGTNIVKSMAKTAAIPHDLLTTKGPVSKDELVTKAFDFATTYGLGIAPAGAAGSGIGRGVIGGAATHVGEMGRRATIPLELEGAAAHAWAAEEKLNRMLKAQQALKIQLFKAAQAVDPKFTTVKAQKAIYHDIEQRLIDPQHEFADATKEYLAQVKGLTDLEHKFGTIVAEKLLDTHPDVSRTFALTNVEGGYLHRIELKEQGGKTPIEQSLEAEGANIDPTNNRARTVSTYASSMQDRLSAVWERPGPPGPDNEATFIRVRAPNASIEEGKPFGHKEVINGHTWTLRPATTEEVARRTGRKFNENHLANMLENIQRLSRVNDNMNFLAQNIKDAEDAGFFVRQKGGKAGQYQTAPQGMIRVDLPGTTGWATPKLAYVLNDFYNHAPSDLEGFLTKAGRAIMASLFISPVIHGANVAAHAFVARGWRNFTPWSYGHDLLDGVRALREVWTMGPRYIEHLKNGNSLQYAGTRPEVMNLHEALMTKIFHEQLADPHTWGDFAKSLGLSGVKELVKAELAWSRRTLWAANDVFMMMNEFRLERPKNLLTGGRGLTIPEAIAKTEEDIPNYRIPAQVFQSHAFAQLLKSQNFTVFGRYHYGMVRALATMVKDMVKGSPSTSRIEAIGKAVALGVMALGAYPLLNQGLQKLTGNPNAEVRPFGPMSVVHAAFSVAQGNFQNAFATVIQMAPLIQIAQALTTNLDHFGRKIVDTAGTATGAAVEAVEGVLSQFPLGSNLVNALRHKQSAGQMIEEVLGQLVGLKLGPGQTPAQKAYWAGRDRKAALRREQKDPITSWLKAHGL